jgi:BirA family biotin operon repressor/biotin-[acetyl-CoA-carboxylase] ligase
MFSDLSRPPLAGLRGGQVRAPAGWRVEVVPLTGSTNTDVVAKVRAGEGPGFVLVAEEQSSGRGRLDRVWHSPPRAGLQFSAVLSTTPSSWVPLLAGVAVARAIREVCGLAPVLKWPNDVLLGDRKVAGILAEVAAAPGASPHVVLGVGLNVTTTREELPADRPATSLALESAQVTDRLTILRAILRELGGDISPVDYLGLCSTVGREVTIHLPGAEVVRGYADSVDEHGRLVVDGVAYAAGDIVHVR